MSQLARKLRTQLRQKSVLEDIESLRRQYHFRKQVPMGPYVVDFASHKARVIVEIDGETHFVGTGALRDQVRDAALAAQGYRVLRFTNEQVMRHADGVF